MTKVSKTLDARLAEMYSAKDDKQSRYDDWAESYDADLLDDLGYVAHLRCAEIFHEVAPEKTARVLDLGCGTGLAGAALTKFGYQNIDGADFSANMLQLAARRKIYRELFQHDILQPPQTAKPYRALISAGLFSYGAPHLSSLPNAVAFVARGGVCVVSVNGRAWVEHDLERELQSEAAAHDFRIVDIVTTDYIPRENIDARVLVLRRA